MTFCIRLERYQKIYKETNFNLLFISQTKKLNDNKSLYFACIRLGLVKIDVNN